MKKTGFVKFKRLAMVLVFLTVVLILIYVFFGSGIANHIKRQKLRYLNVILITLDTLRADHLSCFGYDLVKTPNIDQIAKEGVIFTKCISQVPLTLPAHTTILSGTYPLYHQVRDNGGFKVPEKLLLLSEILKQNHFQTAAWLASFVLHSKWGLNQGFDTYIDKFDYARGQGISLGEVERRAGEILGEVRTWLDKRGPERFFCWIHLYDPHAPYEPPSPYKERYQDHPYRGEVAYMDAELGKFFDYLREKKIMDDTLLIMVGDHGESLGEHQEGTHGFFIYHSTVWVPLIIRAPFSFPQKSVDSYVEQTDLVPTILDALNIPIPPSVQGHSLIGLMLGNKTGAKDMAYCETYYPRMHFAWSELKGLYWRNWKYISAPRQELYDMEKNQTEDGNKILQKSVLSREIRNRLGKIIDLYGKNALSPVETQLDEVAKQKLMTLGYMGTVQPLKNEKQLADPKDKIHILNQMEKSKNLQQIGDFAGAQAIHEDIIAQEPELIDSHFVLGYIFFQKKEYARALECFYKVLELKPDFNFAMINIINSYINLGKFDQGLQAADGYLKEFPGDTNLLFLKGRIYFLKQDYDQAQSALEDSIKADANNHRALNQLGAVLIQKKDYKHSLKFLDRAIDISPTMHDVYFNRALVFEARGETDKAIESYKKELENNDSHLRAVYNLAEILRNRGDYDQAIDWYTRAMQIDPSFNIPYFMKAKLDFDTGKNIDEAVKLCFQGVEIKPIDKYTAFGYFILADIFAQKDPGKSQSYLKKGQEIMARVGKVKE